MSRRASFGFMMLCASLIGMGGPFPRMPHEGTIRRWSCKFFDWTRIGLKSKWHIERELEQERLAQLQRQLDADIKAARERERKEAEERAKYIRLQEFKAETERKLEQRKYSLQLRRERRGRNK